MKTPVALIKGYVSTLRRDDVKWDRKIVDDSLAVIEDEADHLTELIENLLDASRLQAGGFELKRSDVSLPQIAKRMAARFSTQSNLHQFEVDFPEGFPIIMADETRIEQVFKNLIGNAITYSDGGKIDIMGKVEPNEVIVCIKDEGPELLPGICRISSPASTVAPKRHAKPRALVWDCTFPAQSLKHMAGASGQTQRQKAGHNSVLLCHVNDLH